MLFVRASGSDSGILTRLSMHRSYLFIWVYPDPFSVFMLSALPCGPPRLFYLLSKTPHINFLASAMQTSVQIDVNFPFTLTCQKPQTGGCKLVFFFVWWKMQTDRSLCAPLDLLSASGTPLRELQRRDGIAAFGFGTDKHGMICLGSLFVILNKALRDRKFQILEALRGHNFSTGMKTFLNKWLTWVTWIVFFGEAGRDKTTGRVLGAGTLNIAITYTHPLQKILYWYSNKPANCLFCYLIYCYERTNLFLITY